MRHVTEKAKLSHGVVNYHFASKDALYDATLGHLAKEHYDVWTRYLENVDADPARQLAALVAADFDKKVCTSKKLAVWFAFWGQAKYRPNYLRIHNTYDNERCEQIERICGELIKDGGYENLDVARTARKIEALSDGAWLGLLLYPSGASRQDYLCDCLETLSYIFPDHFPVSVDGLPERG